MNKLGVLVGFVPWIVFDIVSERAAANAVAWSALLAVALSGLPLLSARRRAGPKILAIGSMVLFGVIAVVGFAGGTGTDRWLYAWGVPLVGVVLGLYVLATVPFLPFTAEYARQTTPREYWQTPLFRKINTVLSAAWGAAILLMGLASLLVSALHQHPRVLDDSQTVELLLNWVLPIAVIWYMVRFTDSYPDRAGTAAGAAESPPATRTPTEASNRHAPA